MPKQPYKSAVIVPVYNEEQTIKDSLVYFQRLGETCELIFVDGNSSDNTAALLIQNGFTVIGVEEASRGAQLYKGIKHAAGEIILFHHFDTRLPENGLDLIYQSMRLYTWGRFDVQLDSKDWRLRLVQKAMNLRSRWTGIATGDQAMFARKDTLLAYANNLNEYPIMEDIYLSKQLKKITRPACIDTAVVSSARYWEKNGITASILKMWMFRLLYFFGVSPRTLYAWYYSK